MADILPRDLPTAGSVNPASALIFDDGTDVRKATPLQIVEAARPLASQVDAITGTDNSKIMSPLRVKQANAAGLAAKAMAGALGVAGDAADLGVFTGALIPDNSTAKAALQFLETAQEGSVPFRFVLGNQAPVAGSKMKNDLLREQGSFPLENEAGIWSAGTYAYAGFSKEFTAATVPDQGNGSLTGGPLATIFAFANNNGAQGDVVALLGSAVARQTGGSVFGGNVIARTGASVTSAKLTGFEIDVEPHANGVTAAGSIGLAINLFSDSVSPAPVAQFGGIGGGRWANGIISSCIRGAHYAVESGDPQTSVSFINTTQGAFSGAAIELGKGATQGVRLGGTTNSPVLFGDAGNNPILKMGSGGSIVFEKQDGTLLFTFDAFGSIDMPSNGTYKVNGVQVLAQRITGWAAMTGPTDKVSSFDTATITLPQLAARYAALQAAVTAHGLIGV